MNSPGQQVPNMLLVISGEITPERMKGHRALILLACILPGSPLAQRYEDRIEDKANLLDCGKCLASNPSSTTFQAV